jgi:hypothetical protein
MGAFYVNYTVKLANQKSVVKALAGRKAFVTPEQSGAVVVFDQESDNQDQAAIAKLAMHLSTSLRCTVFAILVHDSDIFWFQLYEDGKLRDQYNSMPDYWSSGAEPSGPEGGDAARLCAAFRCDGNAEVESILRMSQEDYPDAMDRHADLVRALNLPDYAVGYGFQDVLRGDLPKSLSAEEMVSSYS